MMHWLLATALIATSPTPSAPLPSPVVTRLTQPEQRTTARTAWKYFERNWDQTTGLVNSVDQLPWTTIWDQGSAILGIHAAHQLGLITDQRFKQRMNQMLTTLETLSLPSTRLPNKAYDTQTARMCRLDFRADPKGESGWSALDLARLLLGLHILRSHYPEFRPQINRIVQRWDLSKLEKAGWLYGSIPAANGQLQRVQEGRLGYEQYAATILQLWGIEATQALEHPPTLPIEVDGVPMQVDQRQLSNSGASNYLTNDPYLLWALELGLPDRVKPQVENLLKVQEQRFDRSQILTAVNEDSLDRPPYFLYYSVHANGKNWQPVSAHGKVYPQLGFLSTKAAFAWAALKPRSPYAQKLRQSVRSLADAQRGYFSGRYENTKYGINAAMNVNTNAVILESLLYEARGESPLARY